MGRDAKLGIVRKRTEEEQDAALRELAEEQMGPMLKRAIYHRNCPKCGADSDKSARMKWCPGADERLERAACKVVGEHLHGTCELQLGGCGFYWREECRDVDENPKAAKRASGA